jgi:hypothetical protein
MDRGRCKGLRKRRPFCFGSDYRVEPMTQASASMSRLAKIWGDPVWSKVIAGAILAGGALALTYFLDLWPTIWQWVCTASGALVALLGKQLLLPYWLVGLALFPILIFVGLAVLFVAGLGKSDDKPAPAKTWRDFTVGEFEGLRWRWRLTASQGVVGLTPFCVACDFEGRPELGTYGGDLCTTFECQVCHHRAPRFDGAPSQLEDKVVRHVQHRLRTGAWTKG